MNATSVIQASIQRPSPSDHRVGFSNSIYEATCRFTCVTACFLAVWKLTTLCYHNAASSYYLGVRTTPRTGLQPVRFTAVTANGQVLQSNIDAFVSLYASGMSCLAKCLGRPLIQTFPSCCRCRRNRRMEFCADADEKFSRIGFVRLLTKGCAGLKIIINCFFERVF